MSLLTELNGELLTEAGLSLLAENETEGGGSVFSLRGKATVALAVHASLTIVKVFIRLPMQAKATLQFSVKPLLKSVRGVKALKAKATLRLLARHGTAKTPSGIGMQMTILADPYRPELIRDQYLQVWFNGHPSQCRIALKIDDGAEFQPAFTWQNPGVISPAIVKIDGAEIPGDGKDHHITASVWQAIGTQTSAKATFSDYAKTPSLRPATQPEWCGATIIRHGETLRESYTVIGHIGDLTRIEWRHSGAVQIMARLPVRTKLANGTWGWKERVIKIGIADHDETTFVAEDIGLLMGWLNGELHEVWFGVASIHNSKFGPVTWANAPVTIREILDRPSGPELTPDEAAGTARKMTGRLKVEYYPDTFNLEVRASVLNDLGTLPSNGNAIIDQAVVKAFLAIKNRIRQGGSVTLDELGRFEARWNPDRTTRSVAFVASQGFTDGTRLGRVLTDAQAKVLNP